MENSGSFRSRVQTQSEYLSTRQVGSSTTELHRLRKYGVKTAIPYPLWLWHSDDGTEYTNNFFNPTIERDTRTATFSDASLEP